VYAQYDIPVREAWKAFLDSLLKSFSAAKSSTVQSQAINAMRTLGSAEATFLSQNGRFGTLEELRSAEIVSNDFGAPAGYRLELAVTSEGQGFTMSMTPTDYGKPARESYFMDESYVLRRADKQGAPATSSDPPIGGGS
jgi:hypothetical protein